CWDSSNVSSPTHVEMTLRPTPFSRHRNAPQSWVGSDRSLPPPRKTVAAAVLLVACLSSSCASMGQHTLVVGSKNFTEQVILGEILSQHLEAKTGLRVQRRFYLAGTYIAQQALLSGRIDTYVEYTGTALTAILKNALESDPDRVFDKVKCEYAER